MIIQVILDVQSHLELHSGIKNVIQDSLEDALETIRLPTPVKEFDASNPPRDLKFCTELIICLLM